HHLLLHLQPLSLHLPSIGLLPLLLFASALLALLSLRLRKWRRTLRLLPVPGRGFPELGARDPECVPRCAVPGQIEGDFGVAVEECRVRAGFGEEGEDDGRGALARGEEERGRGVDVRVFGLEEEVRVQGVAAEVGKDCGGFVAPD
ncbi:MAG: hypothetical protein Q9191_007337, partial [Dirinaria sp. TL-2023a]